MITINKIPVKPEYYPDGTLRLIQNPVQGPVAIEWFFENNEEMLILYFLVKHLREEDENKEISLYMPYIPNARMDRVKNEDEVFTLKYFADFINSLNFAKVVERDAHSAVSLALINNVESEDITHKVSALVYKLLSEKDVLFFPDEGSCKRYAGSFNRPYIYGVKKRDWETGKILGLEVEGDIPSAGFNALIIDDISSYGGTFFHSAKKLKEIGADKIWLYVTHCENSISQGELIKSGLVEKIYTTRSIFTAKHDLVEIV